MIKILLLLGGGAFGTLARYAVSGWGHKVYVGDFPIGTLLVNLVGSLIIGMVWGFFEQSSISSNMRTFLFIGILGGFTTFSSYTLETLNLFRDGEVKLGIMNVLLNNILGLALVFVGFLAAVRLINLIK
jgi:CrcB protein